MGEASAVRFTVAMSINRARKTVKRIKLGERLILPMKPWFMAAMLLLLTDRLIVFVLSGLAPSSQSSVHVSSSSAPPGISSIGEEDPSDPSF